ncbi:Uncharacterised protein [Mycobacterium tuberculosis]|uniref:Uncharacterized protein n=1 Tax=Mycobacterium tuberculosis TaxID=1773 RepID=A0A654U0R8_MYCTX|nr:Uncharacterised protein [Mycobacterium tuberculosis]COZ20787.1 Uncharacterised protein [Mycobacterium tuberculosis]COZ41540.1 Uncharacterised protein [Mycobacterium tuberculosis]
MTCALKGIEKCRPVFRPVKLTTISCVRSGPASGVCSRERRIGLTRRRRAAGGCAMSTAYD